LKLAGETAVIVLSDGGRHALFAAGLAVPEGNAAMFTIEESEDLGIWVRVEREDGVHLVLLLWEFINLVEIHSRDARGAGLRILR
jgi:hypothetical protein